MAPLSRAAIVLETDEWEHCEEMRAEAVAAATIQLARDHAQHDHAHPHEDGHLHHH